MERRSFFKKLIGALFATSLFSLVIKASNTPTINKDQLKGEDIVNYIIKLKMVSIDNRNFGPWKLIIPVSYESILNGNYDELHPGKTIREKIMGIYGIKEIRTSDFMPSDNVLLINTSYDFRIEGRDLVSIIGRKH